MSTPMPVQRMYTVKALSVLVSLLLLTNCATDHKPADVEFVASTNPYHIVQRGETLSSIADKYNMKKIALIRLNRLKPPYRIFINQRLIIIPKEAGLPKNPPRAVVVDSGDVTVRETAPAAAENHDDTHGAYTPTMGSGVVGSPTESPYATQTPLESGEGEVEGHTVSSTTTHEPPQHPPASGSMTWPVRGQVIKGFGPDATGHRNDGINITAPQGTPVQSVNAGTVAHVGNHTSGFGNLVLIKHNDGKISVYGHLDKASVKAGDAVSSGQNIGTVGTSGGVAQPQLHFELRQGKKPLNPIEYLK